jgi:hypothetical protein
MLFSLFLLLFEIAIASFQGRNCKRVYNGFDAGGRARREQGWVVRTSVTAAGDTHCDGIRRKTLTSSFEGSVVVCVSSLSSKV